MGLLQFGPEFKELLPARRSLGTSYVNIAPTTTAYLSLSLFKGQRMVLPCCSLVSKLLGIEKKLQ